MPGSRIYSDAFLAACPQRKGFRLRGSEMTRIEVFTDAAMAFAVTMLIISLDEIPNNYEDFMQALASAPVFVVCVMHVMLFWTGHQTWSRRFGLEDGTTIWLSGAMVCTMLIFIYPLKVLMGGAVSFVTDGWIQSDMAIESYTQLRYLIVVYGVGYFCLCGILVLLNAYALRIRDRLNLNNLEVFDTRSERNAWAIILGTASLSMLLALTLPDNMVSLSTMIYALLSIVMPAYSVLAERRRDRQFGAGSKNDW